MGTKTPKQFLLLDGKPMLMHTIEAFADICDEVILCLPGKQIDAWNRLCNTHRFRISVTLVRGGKTRYASVKNGLKKISKAESVIAIHDGVRPFVSKELIKRCFKTAEEKGNAIPVIVIKSSMRRIAGVSSIAVDREEYRIVQTPQVFQSHQLIAGYREEYKVDFTDDATVVEQSGFSLNLINGDPNNLKITTPSDIDLASYIISKRRKK